MLIFHLLIIGLFLLLGIVFSLGKGAGLIAGYNTSSAEKKAMYDEVKLCKCMSKLIFVLALCWLVISLSDILKSVLFLWVGIGLFFSASVVGIIFINRDKSLRR